MGLDQQWECTAYHTLHKQTKMFSFTWKWLNINFAMHSTFKIYFKMNSICILNCFAFNTWRISMWIYWIPIKIDKCTLKLKKRGENETRSNSCKWSTYLHVNLRSMLSIISIRDKQRIKKWAALVQRILITNWHFEFNSCIRLIQQNQRCTNAITSLQDVLQL